jgi:hypothetical protein
VTAEDRVACGTPSWASAGCHAARLIGGSGVWRNWLGSRRRAGEDHLGYRRDAVRGFCSVDDRAGEVGQAAVSGTESWKRKAHAAFNLLSTVMTDEPDDYPPIHTGGYDLCNVGRQGLTPRTLNSRKMNSELTPFTANQTMIESL